MMDRLPGLWSMANQISTEIERWVNLRDKKHLFLTFRQPDQVRLLKLAVWRERYCLDVIEILDMIMPILRAQVRRPRRSNGLGITIPSLCGDGAERILQQELAKKYPNNEHMSAHKERQRELQLEAELEADTDGLATRTKRIRSILDSTTIGEYTQSYTNSVMRKRLEMNAEMDNPVRKRKAYRNNCWR